MEYQRYAIYWTPEANSPLARWGSGWLGWCADGGQTCPQMNVPGLPRPIEDITAEPRRYGLHATLKAPFRLTETRSRWALEQALEDFAASTAPFAVPRLELATLDCFIALRTSAASAALDRLAAKCVKTFDSFRAAPTPDELARRRATVLSPAQEENLVRWGYPYVMQEFRFHVTLTGRLSPPEIAQTRKVLAAQLKPLLAPPLAIREITLFGDPGQGMPFRLLNRYALTGESASRNAATLSVNGPSFLSSTTSSPLGDA